MKLPIALEIDQSNLKLVFGAPDDAGRFKSAHCLTEPVASLTDEQIAVKTAELFNLHKISPGRTTLCLQRSAVTVRNLHLPSQDPKEIAEMVELHMVRIVPYKKEEIIFSYRFLGVDEMGYGKVLLAIINIGAVRKQVNILEKAGLSIDRVSLSSYGVWKYAVTAYRGEFSAQDLYILLDVDHDFTDFIICNRDNFLFTRSINIGAKDIQAAPETGISKLIGELKQSLIIFFNEELNRKPVRIFLGGADLVGHFSSTIGSELNMPVTLFSADCPQNKAASGMRDVSFSGVAAVASVPEEDGFFFMVPEIQIRKSLRDKIRLLLVLGSTVIYLLTIVCAVFLFRIYDRQNYLKELEEKAKTVEGDMGELFMKLDKIGFIRGYLAERKRPLSAVKQFFNAIPAEISVTAFDMDMQNVKIRGRGPQLSDVYKFVTALEDSKYFKEVQTKYTRKKRTKDGEFTDFELELKLKE
ncbi:MAG: pilus assembly protein PilM [Candidatus Omnitrophota bacterium]|jgi:hypothetical protein